LNDRVYLPMSEQVVLRVGENTFTVRRAVLNSHPCSLLGRAFDRDADGSAGLHQNEKGEYVLGTAELGDAVANGPAALFSSLLGSYSSKVLIPVPGCTRERLLDAAEKLGIDWARTAHDLVSSDSRSDIARGVRMFSVYVLSTHPDDADALFWAALGLHRLGRHRESAVLLARLLDNQPDNAAARSLAVIVSDARAHSRRVGTTLVVSAVAVGAIAGVVATFGQDRVWRCITQTLPRAMERPLSKVVTAARAITSFVTSFFRHNSSSTHTSSPSPLSSSSSPSSSATATSSGRGGVAAAAASLFSFRGGSRK